MLQSQARAFVLSTFAVLAIVACLQPLGVAQENAAPVKKEAPAKKAEGKKEDAKKADAKKDEAKKEDAKKEEKKAEKVEVVIGQAAPAVAVQAVAQAVPPPPMGGPAPAGTTSAPADNELEGLALPKDRDVKKRLDAAELDYIPKKQWPEAVRFLQSVLDRKEDVFVQVKSKGPDGKERTSFVSARGEADRLIGKMDAEGWDTYELQYGGLAKGKLAEYKKSGDPQVLHEVVQRYFHTAGGAEAADLLATYKLDRGEILEAAQIYERLLQRHGADQLGGLTLFKAALAFRLSGNQIDTGLFPKTWKLLTAKIGGDGLQIGDDTVSLAQLQKEVDNAKPGELVGTRSWALFRGDTRRLGVGSGSAPFLENKWRRLMLELTPEEGTTLNANTRTRIDHALQLQLRRPEPMLSAFVPIAAGGKLVYRTYLGIHAVNRETGALEWVSQTNASLDAVFRDKDKKGDAENWFLLYQQSGNQNIIFENSVVGTLSTDNARVYAVDDLGIPPHPNALQGGPWGWNGGGVQISPAMRGLAEHSRLVAIDLETGKLVWERGDPGSESVKEHDKTELADSYFLGPPLPLAGKLYVLTEKNTEMRLSCLDPANGQPLWSQMLATVKDKLLTDVSRRVHAVNLAYGDGVLVCPTNAGGLIAIDPATRSLRWAFPYREKKKEPQQDMAGMGRRGMVMWPGQDPNALGKLNSEWKLTSPVIAEGKVVFTAPDGTGIYCLSLKDGTPLWQADRQDDLYLAGVFHDKVVLVGKHAVRALSLADGHKQLWRVETGMPSGMGVASGFSYYLPLKKGEICKIDLEQGTLKPGSPAPKNERGESEVPGNLLFYEGDVISQTESNVTCYPQVEFKVAQIGTLLKKNPNDPIALTERGELRLYQGDLPGAVADLREAVRHHPPPDLVAKTRNKLYATLTELLKHDFAAGKQYLAEYKDLCKIPIPDGASPEERQKLESEQRRRQAGYLCLFAEGCEKEGRLVDAFQAYLEYGELASGKELVALINEPAVRVKPDLWAQGRIAAMVARATPELRRPLEEEIARRWQMVRADKDPEALPRFVSAFGSLFSVGREARLKLGERLMDENAYLPAELQLLQVAEQRDDAKLAARAVELLGRLMTRRGLMDDAAYFYRLLGRDFAEVAVRDGKTGAGVLADLSADKRFWPYLDEMIAPLSGGTVKVMEIPSGSHLISPVAPFEAKTDLLPFFRRYALAGSLVNFNGINSFQLRLLDKDNNESLWSLTAPASRASYMPYGAGLQRFPFYTKGHLVVLYVGHTVYAIDLIERKKLWEKDLISAERFAGEPPYQQHMLSLDRHGALHISYAGTGAMEKIGQIGPVTSSYVCLRTQEGLSALDPVRGTVLWTKSDLSSHTQVFGDNDYVYLAEVNDANRVGSARAIRGRDGVAADVPDFAVHFQRQQRILGGRLLVTENDPTGSLVLRLYDVPSGKDLYKKTMSPDAIILKSEESTLAGVVEPDGKVTVVDLPSQKEIFHSAVAPRYLEKVKDGLLLQDDRQFYVTLNKPVDPAAQGVQGPWPNLTILRSAVVNGEVYAFNRQTGKVEWHNPVPHQMILLEQFPELPMVLFTAKYNKVIPPQRNYTQVTATRSIDKRTGKLIYPPPSRAERPAETVGFNQVQFHTLKIDRKAGNIDLISPNFTIRHYVGDNGLAGLESGRSESGPSYDAQFLGAGAPRPVKPRTGGERD